MPLLPDPTATPEDHQSCRPLEVGAAAAVFSGDVEPNRRGNAPSLLVRPIVDLGLGLDRLFFFLESFFFN